jgi:chromosome segregation ATPase
LRKNSIVSLKMIEKLQIDLQNERDQVFRVRKHFEKSDHDFAVVSAENNQLKDRVHELEVQLAVSNKEKRIAVEDCRQCKSEVQKLLAEASHARNEKHDAEDKLLRAERKLRRVEEQLAQAEEEKKTLEESMESSNRLVVFPFGPLLRTLRQQVQASNQVELKTQDAGAVHHN